MSLLGLGSNRGGGDIVQAHLRVSADCALVAFSGVQDAVALKAAKPNMVIVGRPLWLSLPEQNDLVLNGDPYLKGRGLADRILDQFGHLPVGYWQGICEGPINARRTALFELGFTRRMHARGMKVCVWNWAVGNGLTSNMGIPMQPDHDLTRPEVRQLFAEADCLGVHAYGSNNLTGGTGLMQDDPLFYALRWKQWEAYYQSQGWKFPKVFLTEFGPHYSWRAGGEPPPVFAKSPQEIIQDFTWLGNNIEQDPNVIGAAAFCYGAEGNLWTGFNLEFEPSVVDAMAECNQNHPGGGEPMPNGYSQEKTWAAYWVKKQDWPMLDKIALENNLGGPMGEPYDSGQWRFRDHVGGIAYAKIGEWHVNGVARSQSQLPPA